MFGSGFASGTLSLGGVLLPDRTRPRPPLAEYYGWTVGLAVGGYSNAQGHSLTILTHEFAHALEAGFSQFIPNFGSKLINAHINAIEKDLWPRLTKHFNEVIPDVTTYWTAETSEFWAHLVTIWYFDIRPGWKFETPEDFIAYDPVMGELISECFVYAPFHELFSADYAVEKGYISAPE